MILSLHEDHRMRLMGTVAMKQAEMAHAIKGIKVKKGRRCKSYCVETRTVPMDSILRGKDTFVSGFKSAALPLAFDKLKNYWQYCHLY